jgi:host factor-I protein
MQQRTASQPRSQIMAATDKPQPLQDTFLGDLRKENADVSIFLMNGIKLVGKIVHFDQYVVLLGGSVDQVIYKSAISTIMPGKVASTSHAPAHRPDAEGERKRTPGGFRRPLGPKDGNSK